jgi:hypothetical protein
VRLLNEQIQELDKRFDATTAAARAYVESAALYGQVGDEGDGTTTTDPSSTTTTTTNSKTGAQPVLEEEAVSTLKPKAGPTTTTTNEAVDHDGDAERRARPGRAPHRNSTPRSAAPPVS